MAWNCPNCQTENDEMLNRCICGYEQLEEEEQTGLVQNKIGGLLYLVLLSMVASLVMHCVYLLNTVKELIDHSWYMADGVVLTAGFSVVTIMMLLFAMILFLLKSRFFPKLILMTLLVNAIADIIIVDSQNLLPLMIKLIGYSLWLVYFLFSQRVKRVFIR